MREPTPVAELFWRRVPCTPGPHACWPWVGKIDRHGYGALGARVEGHKRTLRAHRVAYELLVAPIPEGLVIDHLCRVRHCVNPSHMEPVTVRVNTQRGNAGKSSTKPPGWMPVLAQRQIAKTHCDNGHEFTPENTYLRRGKWRACRACASERRAAWLERQAS